MRHSAKSVLAIVALAIATTFTLTLPVRADSIFYLTTDEHGDTTPYPPGYVTVDVDLLTSTTATVTFTAESTTSTPYYLSEVFFNVNGSYTLTGTGSPSGTSQFSYNTNSGLDSYGTMSEYVRDTSTNDTYMTFSLTDTSGTWATANNVLKLTTGCSNSYPQCFDAAATIGTSTTGNDSGGGTDLAGYYGDTAPPTPEPNSLFLLGTGLIGLGAIARRRFAR